MAKLSTPGPVALHHSTRETTFIVPERGGMFTVHDGKGRALPVDRAKRDELISTTLQNGRTGFQLLDRTKRGALTSDYPMKGYHLDQGHFVRDGYHVEPCTGEAHSNAFIDHCGCCAPRWGWIVKANV